MQVALIPRKMSIAEKFSETDKQPLPQKRIEAFWEVLKAKYPQLLLLGALLALSLSPTVTMRYLTVVYKLQIEQALSAGELTAMEGAHNLLYVQNVYHVSAVLLLQLPALVLAGAAKAIKCLAWREPTPFMDNLGEGVKENYPYYAFCFAVLAILYWAADFVAGSNAEFSFWYYLPSIGVCIIAIPVALWFCASTAVYTNRLGKTLANSIKLYGGTLVNTLCITGLMLSPFALLFVPVAIMQLLLPLLYALLVAPIAMLLWAYYTGGVFDKYVNAESFPDLVNKGLL